MKNLGSKLLAFTGFLILLSGSLKAQSLQLTEPELSVLNGLQSNMARQTKVDQNGTTWVCHDKGIQVFPNLDKRSQNISKTLSGVSLWDVDFYAYNKQQYTAAISFDSGLFIFDQSGSLLKHIALKRTRKLQWVDGKLVVLSANGVFQVTGADTLRLTPACGSNEQITAFFKWDNEFFACTYPSNRWVHYNAGSRVPELTWSESSPWGNDKPILCAKTLSTGLYLGAENTYWVVTGKANSKTYTLNPENGQHLAIWDIAEYKNLVFMAIGNVNNLSNGALIVHHSKTPQTNQIVKTKTPFLWGLHSDTLNRVLWVSSLGKGCFALHYPDQMHDIPFGEIHFQNKTVFVRNRSWIWVQIPTSNQSPTWIQCLLPEPIIDLQSCANQTFVLTQNALYEWSPTALKFELFQSLPNNRAVKIIPAGKQLILYQPYSIWKSIHIQTKQISQWDNSSRNTAHFFFNDEYTLNHDFDGTYSIVDEFNQVSRPIEIPLISKGQELFVSKNILYSYTGSELNGFRVNSKFVEFMGTIPIESITKPGEPYRILTNERGLWVLSSTHIYQVSLFNNEKASAEIVAQTCIGKLNYHQIEIAAISNTHLWVFHSGMWHKIPLPQPKNNTLFAETFSLRHQDGHSEPLNKHVLAIQSQNDIYFSFQHPNYWVHFHDLVSVSLKNSHDSLLDNFIRSGQDGIWLPGKPQGDYAVFLTHSLDKSSSILRAESASGILISLGILFLMVATAVLHFRDKSNRLQSQFALLRWKTLKSNLNPHFIHNSMSLIQALIATKNLKKAIEVTGKIAEINRLYLETNLQELTSLESELSFCRKYVELESLRFGEQKFQFIESIPSSVNPKDWHLPPLLFQPVIENAIKHGLLLERKSGTLSLLVLPGAEKQSLEIQIANTGPGPEFQRSPGTSLGSELVQDRLEHFNRQFKNQYQAHAESGFDLDNRNTYIFKLHLLKTST